jgi:hypothetical protein
MRYEFQRWQRILFPKSNDHAAWMLMNCVGRWWFFVTGWQREYRIMGEHGWIILDFAHPFLKLALEADGERYHMDIVREWERDQALQKMNWRVKHYRFPKLRNEPRKVKREVRRWFWLALITGIRTK